jgi:hypothetical protein
MDPAQAAAALCYGLLNEPLSAALGEFGSIFSEACASQAAGQSDDPLAREFSRLFKAEGSGDV